MPKPQWLKIGIVGRAHGLRGHFYVVKRASPLPDHYRQVVVGSDPKTGVACKVLEIRNQPQGAVILCDAFSDREATALYRGQDIWVKRELVDQGDDSEYLWADLEGRIVVDVDGVEVGSVVDIYNHGASDVVQVQNAKSEILDIALIEDYFDMNSFDKEALEMVVKKDLFDDLWVKV